MKPLHEYLESLFGPNWDLVGDWKKPRGGRKVTKREYSAAVKAWQRSNSVKATIKA